MLSALLGLAGAALVVLSLQDAFEVVLLPRRVRRRVRIMRLFFGLTWRGWRAAGVRVSPGPGREALLGVYGPLAMMALFGTWALGIILGFALLQWPLARPAEPVWGGLVRAVLGSGDAFFTLGYDPAVSHSAWLHALALAKAGIGFSFVAVTISYLPVLHQGFSVRDVQIIQLAVQAGSPATSVAVLVWHIEEGELGRIELWLQSWERWSADLIESHSSFPMLAFYRSQHEHHSWLASLAVVLDCCTLLLAGFREDVFHQAESTFVAARRVLSEVCGALGLAGGGEERAPLDEAGYRAIGAAIAARYPSWRDDARTRTDIAALRATYEPMLARLSRHLLLPLPGCLPPGGGGAIAASDREATIARLTRGR